MVHLAKKKKKGRVYLYLQETGRVNGKSRRLWQIYLGPEHKFKERSQIIQLPEVETETIEFGLIAALRVVAEKLGLVEIINNHTEKRKQGLSVGEHILFAVLNRCLEPVSKSQMKSWFNSTVLRKMYPKVGSALDSRSYWAHFRYLDKKKIKIIEEHIMEAVSENYNVSFRDLLFDPTNFFTYINPKHSNQTLPRHGHSKEGRYTLNIVNVSLFCALDGGIPFLHLVYPGNINDSTHFRGALKNLKQRLTHLDLPPSTITLTFDKGNLSKKAFSSIDTQNYQFIASIRPSTRKELRSLPAEEFKMKTLPNGSEVGVKEVTRKIYGKERRVIAVYNPKQAKWLQENYVAKVESKVKKLREFFSSRLNTSRWSQSDKVLKKCNTVLKSKKFKQAVHIKLTGGKGQLSLSVTPNEQGIQAHKVTLGRSFLMTSRTDLMAWEVVWAYRQQYVVEKAFKYLKNPKFLSIRPMYHRVDSSIQGHIFVCFLGLLLLSLLTRELINQNIPMSIPKAIKILKSIKITKITIPGRRTPVYKVNKMNKQTKAVYECLDLGQFV